MIAIALNTDKELTAEQSEGLKGICKIYLDSVGVTTESERKDNAVTICNTGKTIANKSQRKVNSGDVAAQMILTALPSAKDFLIYT